MSVIRNRQPLTSLNQLQNLFGKSRPADVAQSIVYGDKPRVQSKPRSKPKTENSKKEVSLMQKSQQGSLQQFQTIDHIKSSRAFHTIKSQEALISPERIHSQENKQPIPIVSDRQKAVQDKNSFQPLINLHNKQTVARNNQKQIIDELVNDPEAIAQQPAKLTQQQITQVVERLCTRSSKSVKRSTVESCTFKPQVLEKSKNLRRDKNIADILYDDARSRQQKLQQTCTSLSSFQVSENTQQWYVQRFIKDFYFFLNNTESVQRTQDFSKVQEQDFQYILAGLGFGENAELWKQFTNESFMLSRNMLIILMAILNVQFEQIPLYVPKLEETVQTSNYKQDENGNLLLTQQECQSIHSQYYQLYLNTKQMHGNGQRRNCNRSPIQVINLLSERSRELAEAKRNNMCLNDWFALQEQKKLDNIEKLKQQAEQEQLHELKATKLTIDLTKLSKPIPKQQDKSTIDVEFETQQQFCTFSPQINPVRVFPPTTASTQYDIDQQAKRIREARVRQSTLEKLKSKGNTTNNESRSQAKQKAEKSISQEPTKVKSRPVFLNFPILYVDVKVDDAKTVRLPIYNGDCSDRLAQKFAQDHSLDNSLEERLKDLIEEQINTVVSL